MTDLRTAAEQLLTALDEWREKGGPIWQCDPSITALRAALAEPTCKQDLQVEPVAEPVAWAAKAMELATDFGVESLRVGSHERKDSLLNNGVYTWETSMLRDKREAARDRLRHYLYTAPPQRKPLTEEEIKACEKQAMADGALPHEQRVFFARAIEKAHGIE